MAEEGALWPLLMPAGQQGDDALCAVSAHGVRINFADGTTRLCGTSGLWNVNLGYGNKAIAEAAGRALRDASYLTVWGFEHMYARRAAEALVGIAGPDYARVLFSTSGGAANDAAMKLVRHFHALRGNGERRLILGLTGCFHGLTFGAFALTTARLGQTMYGVDRRLVRHIRPNDVEQLGAVLALVGDRVAAIVIEPVIGTGAIVLANDYVAALLEARSRHGFLIVADEIATGFGRIAPAYFATGAWRSPPDILLTAKALTNGTQAASALIVSREIARVFDAAGALLGHAETQAGTPVVCASLLATLAETERLSAFAKGEALAAQLDRALRALIGTMPLATGISGRGCMLALDLAWADGSRLMPVEVDAIVEAVRTAGALVSAGPSAIQLMPALVYTPADLAELIAALAEGVTAFVRSHKPVARDPSDLAALAEGFD